MKNSLLIQFMQSASLSTRYCRSKVSKVLFSIGMLALCSCRTPYGADVADYNYEGAQQTAAIAISDPQVYARETLVNDRLRERKYLESKLQETEDPSNREKFESLFLPTIQRDLAVYTAFATRLSAVYDRAKQIEGQKDEDLLELDRQRLFLQKTLELEQAKKDLADFRAGKDNSENGSNDPQEADASNSLSETKSDQAEPTVTTNDSDQNGSDDTAGSDTTGENEESDTSLTASLRSRLEQLENKLDALLPGASGDSDFKPRLTPRELLRDIQAYRADLRQALSAINLDDRHDWDGNALYRLQFGATVMPGRHRDKFGVARLSIRPPELDSDDVQDLYRSWVNHIVKRMNPISGHRDDIKINDDNRYLRLAARGFFTLVEFRNKEGNAFFYSAVPSIGEHLIDSNKFDLEALNNDVFIKSSDSFFSGTSRPRESEKSNKDSYIASFSRVIDNFTQGVDKCSSRDYEIAQAVYSGIEQFQFFAASTADPTSLKDIEDKAKILSARIRNITTEMGALADILEGRIGDQFWYDLFEEYDRRDFNGSVESSSWFTKLSDKDLNDHVNTYWKIRRLISCLKAPQLQQKVPSVFEDELFTSPGDRRGQQIEKFIRAWKPRIDDDTFESDLYDFSESDMHRDRLRANMDIAGDNNRNNGSQISSLDFEKHLPNGSAYVYATNPPEVSQSISTTAKAANSLEFAMAVAAKIPREGIEADVETGFLRKAAGKIDAIERIPLVVGFTDRQSALEQDRVGGKVKNRSLGMYQEPQFGWVFGPQVRLATQKKDLELEHIPAYHNLSVDLSLPGWWPSAEFRLETAWIGSWNNTSEPIRTLDDKSGYHIEHFTVPFPINTSDLDGLTHHIVQRTIGRIARTAEIHDINPFYLNACSDEVWIKVSGPDVWRGTRAFLGGMEAKEVEVLPDMEGIAALFSIKDLFANSNTIQSSTPNEQGVDLTLWTRNGTDSQTIWLKGNRSGNTCASRWPVSASTRNNQLEIISVMPATITNCAQTTALAVKLYKGGRGFDGDSLNVILGERRLPPQGIEAGTNRGLFVLDLKNGPFVRPGQKSTTLVVADKEDVASAPIKVDSCKANEPTSSIKLVKPRVIGSIKNNRLSFSVEFSFSGQYPSSVVALGVKSKALSGFSNYPWITSKAPPILVAGKKNTYIADFEVSVGEASERRLFGEGQTLQFTLLGVPQVGSASPLPIGKTMDGIIYPEPPSVKVKSKNYETLPDKISISLEFPTSWKAAYPEASDLVLDASLTLDNQTFAFATSPRNLSLEKNSTLVVTLSPSDAEKAQLIDLLKSKSGVISLKIVRKGNEFTDLAIGSGPRLGKKPQQS